MKLNFLTYIHHMNYTFAFTERQISNINEKDKKRVKEDGQGVFMLPSGRYHFYDLLL